MTAAHDWMRPDVAAALDAIGPRWCEGQQLFEGSPEPAAPEQVEPVRQGRPAVLMLWDEL